jgi:hypothetical protein
MRRLSFQNECSSLVVPYNLTLIYLSIYISLYLPPFRPDIDPKVVMAQREAEAKFKLEADAMAWQQQQLALQV